MSRFRWVLFAEFRAPSSLTITLNNEVINSPKSLNGSDPPLFICEIFFSCSRSLAEMQQKRRSIAPRSMATSITITGTSIGAVTRTEEYRVLLLPCLRLLCIFLQVYFFTHLMLHFEYSGRVSPTSGTLEFAGLF